MARKRPVDSKIQQQKERYPAVSINPFNDFPSSDAAIVLALHIRPIESHVALGLLESRGLRDLNIIDILGLTRTCDQNQKLKCS